jgi:hypothetical protein
VDKVLEPGAVKPTEEAEEPVVEACACGSGIPVLHLDIYGEEVTLAGTSDTGQNIEFM